MRITLADFVKHDTFNTDCGIHDGCLQNSTGRMSAALYAHAAAFPLHSELTAFLFI